MHEVLYYNNVGVAHNVLAYVMLEILWFIVM